MRATLALAPVLLILAACGDDTVAPSDSTGPAETLDGRTFVGSDVSGHDLVGGSVLRLEFRDGQVRASAGCNHLAGTGRLDNGVLVGSIDVTTEMGCERALMDQDAWFSDFLGSRPSAAVTAEALTLSKGETTVTLADEAHVQSQNPIPLEGTTWMLDSVLDGAGNDGAASSVPTGKEVTLLISGSRLTLQGCNEITADVEVTASRLVLSNVTTEDAACEGALEDDVLHVIEDGRFSQDYDLLTLTTGNRGFQFRAATR